MQLWRLQNGWRPGRSGPVVLIKLKSSWASNIGSDPVCLHRSGSAGQRQAREATAPGVRPALPRHCSPAPDIAAPSLRPSGEASGALALPNKSQLSQNSLAAHRDGATCWAGWRTGSRRVSPARSGLSSSPTKHHEQRSGHDAPVVPCRAPRSRPPRLPLARGYSVARRTLLWCSRPPDGRRGSIGLAAGP
jgi:hypothetical protein